MIESSKYQDEAQDPIDLMVEESFPASDPPSFMGATGRKDGERQTDQKRRWLSADQYNYEHFSTDLFDPTHFNGPHIGEQVPDITFFDANGLPHLLREYRGGRVIIETGSLSCPFFRNHLTEMNALASTFAGTKFLVMYVRETYPGRYLPAVSSFTQKWERAKRLQNEVGTHREVVIDSVDGRAHQILGSLPNCLYLIENDGTVGYRSAWADYETVQLSLSDLFDRRIPGGKETNCPEIPSLKVAWQALNRSGWGAVWDAVKSSPEMAKAYYRLQNMQHHHPNQTETE